MRGDCADEFTRAAHEPAWSSWVRRGHATHSAVRDDTTSPGGHPHPDASDAFPVLPEIGITIPILGLRGGEQGLLGGVSGV